MCPSFFPMRNILHVLVIRRVIKSDDFWRCPSTKNVFDLQLSTWRDPIRDNMLQAANSSGSRCAVLPPLPPQWHVERHSSALPRSATWKLVGNCSQRVATQYPDRNATTSPKHAKVLQLVDNFSNSSKLTCSAVFHATSCNCLHIGYAPST